MKYEEECDCGAVMKVKSDDPMVFARVKGRWKLDHDGHTQHRLHVKRKRLIKELDNLVSLVAELRAKAEEVGDWIKERETTGPIVKPDPKISPDVHGPKGGWAKAGRLPEPFPGFNVDFAGDLFKLSPTDTPLLGVIGEAKSALERNYATTFPVDDAVEAARLMSVARVVEAKTFFGGFNEQGKPIQGQGDDGATPPKETPASRRVRRDRMGRRGGQR